MRSGDPNRTVLPRGDEGWKREEDGVGGVGGMEGGGGGGVERTQQEKRKE